MAALCRPVRVTRSPAFDPACCAGWRIGHIQRNSDELPQSTGCATWHLFPRRPPLVRHRRPTQEATCAQRRLCAARRAAGNAPPRQASFASFWTWTPPSPRVQASAKRRNIPLLTRDVRHHLPGLCPAVATSLQLMRCAGVISPPRDGSMRPPGMKTPPPLAGGGGREAERGRDRATRALTTRIPHAPDRDRRTG